MPVNRTAFARRRLIAGFLTVALLAVGGCASVATGTRPTSGTSAALEGDSSRPEAGKAWRRSELYFGVGDRDAPATRIDEARWQAFLDREVTSRFPDGLTVFDAYGQWLFRGRSTPERLDSKVLVILHPDTTADRTKINEIRLAWKTATGHESVLWASQVSEVSF